MGWMILLIFFGMLGVDMIFLEGKGQLVALVEDLRLVTAREISLTWEWPAYWFWGLD